MSVRITLSLLFITLICATAIAPACSSEETESKPSGDAGTDSAADAFAGPYAPGGPCSCDADCIGTDQNPAICLHGMCATRATAACSTPNTEAGCSASARCFDSTTLGGNGVCLPTFDAATCTGGAENRDGVCAPIKGKGCDGACGTLCEVVVPPPGAPGSACGADGECALTDPMCYEGSAGDWFDGYCLSFGCTDAASCGQGGDCLPVASDGSGVCVQSCGIDLDCRIGYSCGEVEGGGGRYCRAGCDAASSCPAGYACVGTKCIDEDVACSAQNPHGKCPAGLWCDQGVCSDEPFSCDGSDDEQEDNDTWQTAKPAATGDTQGLTSCYGDDDWFSVTVPKGKILRVGIEFQHAAGDIDLVVYDAAGKLVGSRYGALYPYAYRDQETSSEFYGLWSEAGGAKYHLRVVGYQQYENVYSLHVDEYDYQDGASCLDLHSLEECISQAPNGEKLLPFPFPDPAGAYAGNNYDWDTYSNYRFARREMVMLVRHALAETSKAFPGTTPLGLIDVCQKDGITPGYDVGSPRHPESTHDQGGNIDLAYFQTDGDNHSEIICGDGSVHADGFCSSAATTSHKVDLPRQAFFMAKLFAYPRTRVVGVDQVIAPLITDAAKVLAALPASDPQHITAQELNGFYFLMASGSGWPYHHHHIHLSLNWWTSAQVAPPMGGDRSPSPSMFRDPTRRPATLETAWPPRR